MKARKTLREKRKFRIRKNLSGTATRPRLSVHRSNRHYTIQAIDDVAGKTLVAVHTVEKGLRASIKNNNTKAAVDIALIFAERAKEKGITTLVFDRNGYAYHGRVKQIAESLRENGIQI